MICAPSARRRRRAGEGRAGFSEADVGTWGGGGPGLEGGEAGDADAEPGFLQDGVGADASGQGGFVGDVDVGGDQGEAGLGGVAAEGFRTVVEFVVADGHRLGADGVLDREFGHAVVGRVEQAALELVPAIEKQDRAAVGLRGGALGADGGGQPGAAAEASGLAGAAAQRPGVDGFVAGVEVVQVDKSDAVRGLAVRQPGQRQGSECTQEHPA